MEWIMQILRFFKLDKISLGVKPNTNLYDTQLKNRDGKIAESFYDIATDFYQYGWGDSFHFAPLSKNKNFNQSIIDHEIKLAKDIGITSDSKVMDLGCGVGGPLINISKGIGCEMTGLTINEYQVNKGTERIQENNLQDKCSIIQGDYLNLPFEDDSYDNGIDVEATAHCTDLDKYFKEVHRVLKKGGRFGGFAWVATDKYDKNNLKQRNTLERVAYGNGLPKIFTFEDFKISIEKSGLKLVDVEDQALTAEIPWWQPLAPEWSISGFKSTFLGRKFTTTLVKVLEFFNIAKKGTVKAHDILCEGADGLYISGSEGYYTPMMRYIVEK